MGHGCSQGDREADKKEAGVRNSGGRRRWKGAVHHLHGCYLSFVVVRVVESQESRGGDDVTETAWHVGQQLPHFGAVPHFCASLWRRCQLSRNLSDSWEWNEVRNQSHILFGNVSAVPICRLRSPTASLSPPPITTPSPPLSLWFCTGWASVPALWNKMLLLSAKEHT